MSIVSREQGVTLVQVDPDYDALDEWRIRQFCEELLAAVDHAEPPLLVMDLSRTAFIGSSFIGVLIRAWKRVRSRNGRMALCGVSRVCLEVLQVSKLDSIWDICLSREAAIEHLLSPES